MSIYLSLCDFCLFMAIKLLYFCPTIPHVVPSSVDRICKFIDVKFLPFKLQYVYGGCMQCVCWVYSPYEVLVCRMICPNWFKLAGPQLRLSPVKTAPVDITLLQYIITWESLRIIGLVEYPG